MTMGERIKHLRKLNNMTQEELGNVIGVQKSAIRKYEKGEVQNIKISSIGKMANIFNVSPAFLMGWEDEEETKTIELTLDEIEIIKAYRSAPHMQEAVKKLLGVE